MIDTIGISCLIWKISVFKDLVLGIDEFEGCGDLEEVLMGGTNPTKFLSA